MKTTSEQRIAAFANTGWWTGDTLHSLLNQAVAKHPERLAVADQPNREQLTGTPPLRINYRELDELSDLIAAQLLAAGLGSDDILLVQLPNVVELVITYYAASKIGCILSPVPVQYRSHELRAVAAKLSAQLIVTTTSFKEEPLAQLALDSGLQPLVFNGLPEDPWTALSLSGAGNTDSTGSTKNGAVAGALEELHTHREHLGEQIDDANSILTIGWTSGTTGTPKGVPRSHNMWMAVARNVIETCGYREGDQLLNPFPLINMAAIGGFLYPAVSIGASLFLHHPLDPAMFLHQLQAEAITYTIAPPALLNHLAKSKDLWTQFDFSALRCVGSGSAPLPAAAVEIFESDYGKEIVNIYGSNEGISLLSTREYAPEPEARAVMFPRWGVAGQPWSDGFFNDNKTRVIDTDTGDEITEAGVQGELVVDGPTVFDGYFGSDNNEVFTPDGYFRTGDLVEICGKDNGFYRIVGRCKDIINRGGTKISPIEIDNLLDAMPGVAEAAVCSYPDPVLGEKICACVVPSAEATGVDLPRVINYLEAAGLAKYKLPERLELFDALPRNPMNKVLRYQLQDEIERRSMQ